MLCKMIFLNLFSGGSNVFAITWSEKRLCWFLEVPMIFFFFWQAVKMKLFQKGDSGQV